jgi:acylphosphatase
MVKAFIIAHGNVQGVGYRSLVARVAKRYGIKGTVRNADNGSVQIMAIADKNSIDGFIREINMSVKNGPDVMNLEIFHEEDEGFPKNVQEYTKFSIIR